MAESSRPRRGLRWLALALPLTLLVGLDLLLRAVGWLPPDDPLLFFARSHEQRFSPFVVRDDGARVIRPDWVNDGKGMRGTVGRRAGRQFLYPGFRPAVIVADKPERALRVFALGGSSTFGLYIGAEGAFPAALARALRAALPDRPVEVVNLGCAGFASDRVLGLLEVVLGLDPDLVVVYSGHNEMLGGNVGATSLEPALALRARLLRLSSLFAWWNHWLAGTLRSAESEAVAEEVAALEAGHIPTFIPEALPPGELARPEASFRAAAAARYRSNLAAMIEAARGSGVPLLFALPVANLLTPPLSLHPEDFSGQTLYKQHERAAQALREAGKLEAALSRLDAAVALSPDYARAHYDRGLVLASLGRSDEARDALQRAIDVDVRTYRITSPLEQSFRESVDASSAVWVDPGPVFHETLSEEVAEHLFSDHLHPTAAGHERLAELLLPEALRLLRAER